MGLYSDSNPLNQPKDTWRDARNILISRLKDTIVLEEGNEILTDIDGIDVLKAYPLPDESIFIFGLTSLTNTSVVGLVDINGDYESIIIDNLLNFKKENKISCEIEFNAQNERIIAFTDDLNPPKYLNIDDIPFALDGNKALVNAGDINDMYLFPESNPPVINFDILKNSGNVKTGVVFATFSYKNNDGTQTNYHDIFGPITISKDEGGTYKQLDGDPANTGSGKSVSFSLTNVDTRFDKINLAILSINDGIITASSIKDVPIVTSNLNVVYTGTETVQTLTLEEVIIKNPLYTKAKVLAAHQDRLYLGNLETEEDISLQEVANGVSINYNTMLITANNIAEKAGFKTNQAKGFMHGEVYAFYLTFELTNGSLSRAFHIPGRQSLVGDSFVNDIPGFGLNENAFKFEDTSNKAGSNYTTSTIDGNPVISVTTSSLSNSNMGYWQNEDETYPSDFPDFPNQNVRHHVFPSVGKVKTTHYSTDNSYGINKLDTLGIDVKLNVAIPDELKSKIKGWFIQYAVPSISNNIILAEDMIHYAAQPISTQLPVDADVVWSAGGNFKTFVNSGGDSFTTNLRYNYLRATPFDLIKNKPSISPTYIQTHLIYNKTNLNKLYANEGVNGVEVYKSGASPGESNLSVGVIDLTTQTTTSNYMESNYRRVLTNQYLAQDTIDGDIYNLECQETLLLELNSDLSVLTDELLTMEVNAFGAGYDASLFSNSTQYQTALYTIGQLKQNVYLEFISQQLASTNKLQTDLSVSTATLRNIRGGDTVVSQHSYISKTKGSPVIPTVYSKNSGICMFYSFLCHSRNNSNLRHETNNDVTKYYPKSDPESFFINPTAPTGGLTIDFANGELLNSFGYNSDYTLINEFNDTIIATPDQETVSNLPHRVIRSGIQQRSAINSSSWRTFLANDYYETNKNRGEIINLSSLGDIFIIHHQYGLFRTASNYELRTSALEVTLGNTDIFEVFPKEPVISQQGYLGIQDVSCAIICKAGYFWVDTLSIKCFLMSPNLEVAEISNYGIRNFLRSVINIFSISNILLGDGLTACFDEFNNRIVLTQINPDSNKSFTLSYDISNNKWVCFHDYIPTILLSTRNHMYSYKAGTVGLWQHNVDNKGIFYGIVYSSYIEFSMNEDKDADKLFYSLAWITEVKDSNGNLLRDNTFDKIKLSNSYIDLVEKDIIPFTKVGTGYNVRRRQNTWTFNDLKEANAAFYKRRKLIDKYLLVKLTFNNTISLDSSQKSLYLYNIAVQTEPIFR
jgi:hypothetical protein